MKKPDAEIELEKYGKRFKIKVYIHKIKNNGHDPEYYVHNNFIEMDK